MTDQKQYSSAPSGKSAFRNAGYLSALLLTLAITGTPALADKQKQPSQTQPAATDSDTPGQDTPVATTEEEASPLYTTYIRNKLKFGTRVTYRTLTDSDSGHFGGTYGTGTFLGTIYALDEKQSYAPTGLFVGYDFNQYVGVEIGYDSIEAKTVATNYGTSVIKTDGDVSLKGPTVSLLARIPNASAFTPFLGIGLGLYSGDFSEDPAWAYTAADDRRRVMEVDDVTALILTAGSSWDFSDHWFMDCSVQYITADPDATFYGYTRGELDTEQTGHFPLDNYAFRIGLGYTF